MKPVASRKRWKRRAVISPSFVVGRGLGGHCYDMS